MIKPHTLDESMLVTIRYLKAARALRAARRRGGSVVKAHAAVKRASMDLSRCLADVRQSR